MVPVQICRSLDRACALSVEPDPRMSVITLVARFRYGEGRCATLAGSERAHSPGLQGGVPGAEMKFSGMCSLQPVIMQQRRPPYARRGMPYLSACIKFDCGDIPQKQFKRLRRLALFGILGAAALAGRWGAKCGSCVGVVSHLGSCTRRGPVEVEGIADKEYLARHRFCTLAKQCTLLSPSPITSPQASI